MQRSLLMVLALLGCTQACVVAAEKVLVEAGKFTEVFDPKAGEKDPWCINDHTFVRGPDGTWHVFAITHILPVNFARDPGKNLLHATAKSLTQSPWHKEPFAVTADWDKYGEWLFWAPHVIRNDKHVYQPRRLGARRSLARPVNLA
jgi:arabinan endo-1,5-alpha-L-arabinosidase